MNNDPSISRARRAAHFFYGLLFLIALASVLLGLVHVTRFRALPEDERAYGFSGSVKGRLFSGPFAAGHFAVGASGSLRLNLDNHSGETYRLILRMVPRGESSRQELDVPPGLTKLNLKPGRGPAYLEFRWDRIPDRVVLNTVQSSEYRRFRHLMVILFVVALLAGLLFFLATVKERARGLRRAAFSIFFLFFALYFFVFDRALIPLTGDEPHYMVLAESILRDGDLSVENNYTSVWRHQYYPGAIDRHTTETTAGEIASHYPLLAVLLGPAMIGPAFGFQVGPYTGAKLILLLLASLTAAFVFGRVLRVTRRGAPRLFAGLFTLICFASLPFLPYSNQIFPELPAGLLLFLIVSGLYDRSLRPPRPGRPFPGGGIFRLTIPVMVLPWANLKFALPALLCGLYLIWLSRGAPRRLFFTTLFLTGGAIAMTLFTFGVYGETLGPYSGQRIVFKDFWTRYGTYLFDADRGLLAMQPLLLWAAPGIAVFWRRSRMFVLLLIAVLTAAHLPNLLQEDERNWLLGYCPAGRYWIAVLPLLIWTGARGMASMVSWPGRNPVLRVLRGAAIALSVPALLIGALQSAAFLKFQEGYYLPLHRNGNAARYLLETTGIDIAGLFAIHPFTETFAIEGWILGALVFVLLALTMSGRKHRRR